LQHAEEYREGVLPGAFTRLVRMFGIMLSWFLPPLYVLITQEKQLLPESLQFLGPEKVGQIPLFAQFFLGEIGIDLIRIALIHTPNALGTSLGLIGAILLGEMAVEVGLFAPEAILYVALAALGSFGTPSFEFSQAVRLWRLVHLVAVGFFGWQGLVISMLANLAQLLFTRSYGIPYLWPLLPLNLKAMGAVLFRRPVPNKGARPAILKPQDPDHMSGEGNS
jgi:stage V sporulation protein AF